MGDVRYEMELQQDLRASRLESGLRMKEIVRLEAENARIRELLEFTAEAIENSAKLRGVSASLAVARQRIGSELSAKEIEG